MLLGTSFHVKWYGLRNTSLVTASHFALLLAVTSCMELETVVMLQQLHLRDALLEFFLCDIACAQPDQQLILGLGCPAVAGLSSSISSGSGSKGVDRCAGWKFTSCPLPSVEHMAGERSSVCPHISIAGLHECPHTPETLQQGVPVCLHQFLHIGTMRTHWWGVETVMRASV